ncbi:hypothetical protein F5X96DRAFT_81709 [Biscogniauxia mediterranea]|nr:hypothetical protein F5X96DRAFT_81709 [Biscogniauxia mediterranea]
METSGDMRGEKNEKQDTKKKKKNPHVTERVDALYQTEMKRKMYESIGVDPLGRGSFTTNKIPKRGQTRGVREATRNNKRARKHERNAKNGSLMYDDTHNVHTILYFPFIFPFFLSFQCITSLYLRLATSKHGAHCLSFPFPRIVYLPQLPRQHLLLLPLFFLRLVKKKSAAAVTLYNSTTNKRFFIISMGFS